MPYLHSFIEVSIDGDTEVSLQGSHDVRIVEAINTPRLIALNGGSDGIEMCIHNLSGVGVPVVHNSGAASAVHRKILCTGLGGDFTLPDGQIVWLIQTDPNDGGFPDADRGWYLDSGGQEVLARGSTVASTSGPSTSSGTPAVIPQMTLTLTTVGGVVLVAFTGTFTLLTADAGTIALYVDGVEVASSNRGIAYVSSAGALDPAASIVANYGFVELLDALAPGSHTFDVRWAATGGSIRGVGIKRHLVVEEKP